jgi:hypothetical protein
LLAPGLGETVGSGFQIVPQAYAGCVAWRKISPATTATTATITPPTRRVRYRSKNERRST